MIGIDDPSSAGPTPVPAWQSPRSRANPAAEAEVLACVRNDQREKALTLMMATYERSVTALAVRVLRNAALAKDVRQQVFLEAFQGIAQFAGRGTLLAWLCGITYHRCLDEIRRGKRAIPTDNFDVLDRLADEPDPVMDADRLAQRRALEHCLAKLGAEQRGQLLMRYRDGLSYVEIGEIVQDSPGTVQVRMSRILPKVRRCLRGQGVAR